MTAPGHSPQDPPKRSRRLYILWAVALTLLLAAGLFCWLVVVPVCRTRAELQRLTDGTVLQDKTLSATIDRLGGPQAAIGRIAFYLKLPCRTEDLEVRWAGVWVLGHCGREAIPVLEGLRQDFDPKIKMYVREALEKIKAAESDDVPAPVPLADVSALVYSDESGQHPAPVSDAYLKYKGKLISVRGVVTGPGVPPALATGASTGLHTPPDPRKEALIPVTGKLPPERGKSYTATGKLVKNGEHYSLQVIRWKKVTK
jgi:hypothetical protein